MVNRVYVEKKPGFDGEAAALAAELRDIVGIAALFALVWKTPRGVPVAP